MPSTLIGRNASDFTSTGIAPGRERMRRSKVHRLAENQILRRLHIRKDRLIRLLRASRQPGQRKRRAHHLQKAAPAHRIDPLARLRTRLPRKLLGQHRVEARLSASSSRFFQNRLPRVPSSFARTSAKRQLRRAQSRSPPVARRFPVFCSMSVVFIGGMSRSLSARSAVECGTAPSGNAPGPSGW